MKTTADSFKVVMSLGAGPTYLWAEAYMALHRQLPYTIEVAGKSYCADWVNHASRNLIALERLLRSEGAKLVYKRFDVLRDAWQEVLRECAGCQDAATIGNVNRCLESIEEHCIDPEETYG